ncbi:MAG: hypothetical protein ACR2PY_07025 [Salinispira sp.]
MNAANSRRPQLTILIIWAILSCMWALPAQELPVREQPDSEIGASEGPTDLEQLIGEINTTLRQSPQQYSLRLFRGNRLFIGSDPLSESQFHTGSIYSESEIPVFRADILTRLRVGTVRIEFSQPLSLEEEVLLMYQTDIIFPELPETFSHLDSSLFAYFTVHIRMLYEYENLRFNFYGAQIDVTGEQRREGSGSPGSSGVLPGSPLLIWQAQGGQSGRGGHADIQESRNLARILFNRKQEETENFRYRYNSRGEFYELQQVSANSEKRFVTLDENEQGLRVLIFDKNWSTISLRRFDDQGRLRYSDIKDNASNNQSTTHIQYLDNGNREEVETFSPENNERRTYDAENNLLSSLRNFPDGRSEERSFTYTDDGNILREEFQGILSNIVTTYQYNGDGDEESDDEVSRIETTEDGYISRIQEIDDDETRETRYLRGKPILRIYLKDGKRIAEEELFEDTVIRRREYDTAQPEKSGTN